MRRAFVAALVWLAGVGSAAAQVPQFRDFPAPVYTGPNAPVQLITPSDKMFRTRLREGATRPVNFAGHYILTTWGCGTSCETGSVIDAKTGEVIDLPGSVCCEPTNLVDDNFKRIIARRNSRLIILSGLINEQGDKGVHFYYLEAGRFIHVADASFKTRDTVPQAQLPTTPSQVQAPDRHSSTPEVSKSRDRTVNALSQCFAREYSLNNYSSLDGGRSSLALLSKCGDEWNAASRQCQLDGGGSDGDCNLKTGILAQAFLKLKEAGFQ